MDLLLGLKLQALGFRYLAIIARRGTHMGVSRFMDKRYGCLQIQEQQIVQISSGRISAEQCLLDVLINAFGFMVLLCFSK